MKIRLFLIIGIYDKKKIPSKSEGFGRLGPLSKGHVGMTSIYAFTWASQKMEKMEDLSVALNLEPISDLPHA